MKKKSHLLINRQYDFSFRTKKKPQKMNEQIQKKPIQTHKKPTNKKPTTTRKSRFLHKIKLHATLNEI